MDTPYGILNYDPVNATVVVNSLSPSGKLTEKQIPIPQRFSPGWTNIVNTKNGILWYNANTGSIAVIRIDQLGLHLNKTEYGPDASGIGWSSIVNTENGIIIHDKNNETIIGKIELMVISRAINRFNNSVARMKRSGIRVMIDRKLGLHFVSSALLVYFESIECS